jgi:hypothetical protein
MITNDCYTFRYTPEHIMAKKLTDKGIERMKSPRSSRLEIWDSQLGGFGLRLTAHGMKSFQLIYRYKGEQRRVTLGRYRPAVGEEDDEVPPDHGMRDGLTLAQARAKARGILRLARAGKDPIRIESEAKAKQARFEADTFAAIRARFVEEYCKPRLRSWRVVERYLTRDLSDWDDRPIRTITKRDIIEAVERKARMGGPISANRLVSGEPLLA